MTLFWFPDDTCFDLLLIHYCSCNFTVASGFLCLGEKEQRTTLWPNVTTLDLIHRNGYSTAIYLLAGRVKSRRHEIWCYNGCIELKLTDASTALPPKSLLHCSYYLHFAIFARSRDVPQSCVKKRGIERGPALCLNVGVFLFIVWLIKCFKLKREVGSPFGIQCPHIIRANTFEISGNADCSFNILFMFNTTKIC